MTKTAWLPLGRSAVVIEKMTTTADFPLEADGLSFLR
jgi:hypothetical protein